MSDWECPHCGTEYDATGSHRDDAGEHTCDECGGDFEVTIEYTAEYYATAIPCVLPEQQKHNDAIEHGDELRDRAKDERVE